MTVNLAFRGYLNGQVVFQETFTYDHLSDGRDIALSALAKTHARVLDHLHEQGRLDPWCAICDAPSSRFHVHIAPTSFRTQAQAEEALEASAAAQAFARHFLRQSRN